MFKKLPLLLIFFAALHSCAQAQVNYVNVTANGVKDATGALISSGQFIVWATDDKDNIIAFAPGGGGQAIKTKITRSINNGAITASLQVANPAFTKPINIYYHVQIKDITHQTTTDYSKVVIAAITGMTSCGAGCLTWSWDNYDPTQGAPGYTFNLVQGPAGPPGPAGPAGTGIGSPSYTGNTTQIWTATGSLTATHSVVIDASHNLIDSGDVACLLGTCTFTALPTLPGTTPTGNQAASASFVQSATAAITATANAALAAAMNACPIAGCTFSGYPILPDASPAASQAYVLAHAGSGGGSAAAGALGSPQFSNGSGGLITDTSTTYDTTNHILKVPSITITAAAENGPRSIYDPMSTKYAGGLASATTPAQQQAVLQATLDQAWCDMHDGLTRGATVIWPVMYTASLSDVMVPANVSLECSAHAHFGLCQVSQGAANPGTATGSTGHKIFKLDFTNTSMCHGSSLTSGGDNAAVSGFEMHGGGAAAGGADEGVRAYAIHNRVEHNGFDNFGGPAIEMNGTPGNGYAGFNYVQNSPRYWIVNGSVNPPSPVGAIMCVGTDTDCEWNQASTGAPGVTGGHVLGNYPNVAAYVIGGGSPKFSNNFAQISDIGLIQLCCSGGGAVVNFRADFMSGAAIYTPGSGVSYTGINIQGGCGDPAWVNATSHVSGCHLVEDNSATGNLYSNVTAINQAAFQTSYVGAIFGVGVDTVGVSNVVENYSVDAFGNGKMFDRGSSDFYANAGPSSATVVNGTCGPQGATTTVYILNCTHLVFNDTVAASVQWITGGINGQFLTIEGTTSDTIVNGFGSNFTQPAIRLCGATNLVLGNGPINTYYTSVDHAWHQICGLAGPGGGGSGAPGAPGASFDVGSGAPTGTVGNDGDNYLDVVTGNVYGPRTGGVWPSTPTGNLAGPPGATGATGAPGTTTAAYPAVVAGGNISIDPPALACGDHSVCGGPTDTAGNPSYATFSGTTISVGGTSGQPFLLSNANGICKKTTRQNITASGSAAVHYVYGTISVDSAGVCALSMIDTTTAGPVATHEASLPTAAGTVSNNQFTFDVDLYASRSNSGGAWSAALTTEVTPLFTYYFDGTAVAGVGMFPYGLGPSTLIQFYGEGTAGVLAGTGSATVFSDGCNSFTHVYSVGSSIVTSHIGNGSTFAGIGFCAKSQWPNLGLGTSSMTSKGLGVAGPAGAVGTGQTGTTPTNGGYGGAGGCGGNGVQSGTQTAGKSGGGRMNYSVPSLTQGGCSSGSGNPGMAANAGWTGSFSVFPREAIFGGSGGPGSPGNSDGTNAGASGGNSGAPFFFAAPGMYWASGFSINSNGNGGTAATLGNTGGGGGGGAGLLLLETNFISSAGTIASQVTASGGAAGANVGTATGGTAGGNGATVIRKPY